MDIPDNAVRPLTQLFRDHVPGINTKVLVKDLRLTFLVSHRVHCDSSQSDSCAVPTLKVLRPPYSVMSDKQVF